MTIYDCFTYFAEEELLELRFKELHDVVDYHVIVESTHTFRGKPKPSHYMEVAHKFKKYANKIIYYQVQMPSELTNPWDREAFQRNSVRDALQEWGAWKHDLILVSDADEIPRPQSIWSISLHKSPVYFDVDQYYWNFNWRVPAHCNEGGRPYAIEYKYLRPQKNRAAQRVNVIPNGGWHFSYYGSYEKNKQKIESFAHSEYDLEEYKTVQHMQHCIEEGLDPFGRFPLKWYDIEEATHPKSLTHKDKHDRREWIS